jgi:hypothetical protein
MVVVSFQIVVAYFSSNKNKLAYAFYLWKNIFSEQSQEKSKATLSSATIEFKKIIPNAGDDKQTCF